MITERFRVMAVDDDQDVLDLIQYTLGDNYEVVTCRDSAEACDVIDICEPDALIVDIMMPKVTGYRIVEHIKENTRLHNSVVIFLSAKDSPRDIKYGYKVGANLYLTKPFQPERLLRTLQTLLSEGAGHPRRKTLTLRDIQMRMKYRFGMHGPGSPATSGRGGSDLAKLQNVGDAAHDEEEFHPSSPPEEVDPFNKKWVD